MITLRVATLWWYHQLTDNINVIIFYHLDWPIGWPFQADLCWLTCLGCMSSYGYPFSVVLAQQSCPSCHVVAILSSRFCSGWPVQVYPPDHPVQTDLSLLLSSDVLSQLSWCPVLVVLSQLYCPGYLVLVVLPVLPLRSCLGCPAPAVLTCLLAVLSVLSCKGCPATVVLSRLFLSSWPVLSCHVLTIWLSVLTWLSCPRGFVLAVVSLLSCSGRPVLSESSLTCSAWLFRSTCLSRDVPAVLSRLYCPGCPTTLILSKFYCPGCHVLAVFSSLSCSGHPLFSVLSRLTRLDCGLSGWTDWTDLPSYPVPTSCPSCLMMAVLSRLSCLICPVSAVLSCQVHTGLYYLFYNWVLPLLPSLLSSLAVLSRMPCPKYPVPAVMDCPYTAVLQKLISRINKWKRKKPSRDLKIKVEYWLIHRRSNIFLF